MCLCHPVHIAIMQHKHIKKWKINALHFCFINAYVTPVDTTGGPDVVFDFGDCIMSSADKTMYENTLNIALNRTLYLRFE